MGKAPRDDPDPEAPRKLAGEPPVAPACRPDQWVDLHGDAMFSYALMRLRDRDLAEEVVQEAFLAAVRGIDRFQGKSSERTWLIGILKHKILDVFAKRRREGPVAGLDAGGDFVDGLFDPRGMWKQPPADWRPDPAKLMEQGEFWAAFEQCMEHLPQRLAEVFSLRVVDENRADEVCKVLGITDTNLWVLLHRARTRLRHCLEANWFRKKGKTAQT